MKYKLNKTYRDELAPMVTLQIRLTHKTNQHIQDLVVKGFYHSKSECIRDAVRRFLKKEF